jgi:hypothetical protein
VSGLRLTAQAGYSFDLKKSVNRDGFDFRTGAIVYVENRPTPFLLEHYGESLYLHRYRDWISAYQLRLVYPTNFPVSPIITGVAQIDSAGLVYNRFIEIRAGLRAQLPITAKATLQIQPNYVFGRRKQENFSYINYGEFRALAAFAAEF